MMPYIRKVTMAWTEGAMEQGPSHTFEGYVRSLKICRARHILQLCRAPDYVDESANDRQKVNIFQWFVPYTERHIRGIILGAFATSSVANRLHFYPLRY